MSSTKRLKTGVSLPKDTIELLDKYMEKFGIKSRSKVITEAVRSYVTERLWLTEKKNIIGVIIIIYNEKRGETVKKLLDAQHEFIGEIISSTHFHISHDTCLEVIMTKGQAKNISNLISKLENIIGVEMVKFFPAIIIE